MTNKNDIPPEKVQMLASFGCSYIEIGKYFGCSEGLIRRRFRTEYERGREEMKLSLRQMQWKACQAQNSALLIFLGKNYSKS